MKLENIIYRAIGIGLYFVIPGLVYRYILYPETFSQRVSSLIICFGIFLIEAYFAKEK